MDSQIIKKRDRAVNFSSTEARLLVDIVENFKNIVENKKTDAVTNKDKEAAWIEIAAQFNATSGVCLRNPKMLKLKYETLKKNTKKKAALNRQNLYKTGGGEAEQIPFNSMEEKILAICSNIGGLEALNDSDAVKDPTFEIFEVEEFPNEMNDDSLEPIPLTSPKETDEENENEKTDLPSVAEQTNWKAWNPTALKKKITPSLRKSTKIPKNNAVRSKFEELGDARLELVKLQIEIAKNELESKKAEHELRKEEHEVKLRNLFNEDNRKEEEHVLKMEKMRNPNKKQTENVPPMFTRTCQKKN